MHAAAISSTEFGLTSSAALPAVSGIADVFEVITGVPQAIASDDGHTESLPQGGIDERVRGSVEVRKLVDLCFPNVNHCVAELEPLENLRRLSAVPASAARQDELMIGSMKAFEKGECLERSHNILSLLPSP